MITSDGVALFAAGVILLALGLALLLSPSSSYAAEDHARG